LTIKLKFKFVDKLQDAKIFKKELSKKVNDLKFLPSLTDLRVLARTHLSSQKYFYPKII